MCRVEVKGRQGGRTGSPLDFTNALRDGLTVANDRYANASVAIDYLATLRRKQNQAFERLCASILSAEPAADLDVDALPPLPGPRESGTIEARAARLATVRAAAQAELGSILSGVGTETQHHLARIEQALWPQLSAFQANGFLHPSDRMLFVTDDEFDASLKLLTALAEMASTPGPIAAPLGRVLSWIAPYYEAFDLLAAEDFYLSHHRHDDWKRVGPYSLSSGLYSTSIERPAALLSADQRSTFVDRILEKPGPTPTEEQLVDVGPEPIVLTLR